MSFFDLVSILVLSFLCVNLIQLQSLMCSKDVLDENLKYHFCSCQNSVVLRILSVNELVFILLK